MKRKGQIPDSAGSKERDLARGEMEGAKERLESKTVLVAESGRKRGLLTKGESSSGHDTHSPLFFTLNFIYQYFYTKYCSKSFTQFSSLNFYNYLKR